MEVENLLKKVEEYYRENVPVSRDSSYFPHVDGVRKYALILAKEYKADQIVIEVAALLHDIGADAGKVHAFKSAEITEEFLSKLNVDSDLKARIVSAIKNHSMNQSGEDFTVEVPIEDRIIRDADGLSFLENSYEAYLQKGLKMYGDIEKAKEEAAVKIIGMSKKITTQKGKEIAKELIDKALEFVKDY